MERDKAQLESDEEPTLGELVEMTKREQTADIHEREDAVLKTNNVFIPHWSDWTPHTVSKRGKKSRPREISSKRPVPLGRERCLGLGGLTERGRSVRNFDPRFEVHCGDLREEHVERNYSFVNAFREKYQRHLQDVVNKDASNEQAAIELTRLEQDDERQKIAARRKEILRNLRKEEKEAVKRGKKPYFLKEKDIQRLELQAKFEDIKKRGGLEKYIEKRRRRIASKDRKLLPEKRETS